MIYKKEHLKHYLVSNRSLLKSCSSLRPCPVVGYAKEQLSLKVQFHVMVELSQKLTAVSLTLNSSPNPVLSSLPHGPSTAYNSSWAYIVAQQAKFISSQATPLKKQPAETLKEVPESG